MKKKSDAVSPSSFRKKMDYFARVLVKARRTTRGLAKKEKVDKSPPPGLIGVKSREKFMDFFCVLFFGVWTLSADFAKRFFFFANEKVLS